ncbi:MAG: M36 family metallopeptidase [Gilvibacter sp.]
MKIFYNEFLSKAGKQFLMPLFFLLFVSIGFAQKTDPNVSKALNEMVQAKSLVSSDIEYVVTADHISSVSGTHHIYFNQAINGVKINGTESSIHITNSGKVLKNNTNFINNVLNEIKNGRSAALTPQAAIQSVASKYNYRMTESLTLVEQKSATSMIFSDAGISDVAIPVKQVYYYKPKEGVYLAWELSIAEVTSSDWWNFHVDALSGEIMDFYNFTNYCNFEHDHSSHTFIGPMPKPTVDKAAEATAKSSELAVPVPSQYQVFAMPIESPLYGSRTVEVSPENTTASPHGWHDTNNATGAEFTYTRGNNAYAYEDGDNAGFSPNGGASLDFSFSFVEPYTVGTQSESAAITNLFYWSNIIHDVMYLHGFTESAGNFQENNYGNGGAGGDSVNAEAQDGSGTCNANFGTPSDGGNPTMQMFVCDINGNGTFNDGDFDNGVIIHEYGHGISNRLTGGPAAAGCLGNTEQMGEGWSDFYGLIFTLEPGDTGADRRPIGNYLLESTPAGGGIRTFPYSTSMAINSHTYDDIRTEAVPHGVGSVWAMMVWEMTWGLIDAHGFDADIYNGTGGNNIALTLVTEGMKLQGCSPGFVDGRDAILLADQNIYGGANQCIIWTAFAKRGLGLNASQGSSASRSDGTEDFTGPVPAFVVSADTFCSTEGTQTLSGATALNPGTYSGPGVTASYPDGTFDFDPSAAGIGVHTITFTTTDCDGNAATPSDTITVTDGNPLLVCMDATLTLDGAGNATLVNADVVDNLTAGAGYTIDQTGTFAPEDITAVDTEVVLGDDAGIGVPVGFTFNFFQTDYTTVYIASNGYLSFTNAGLGAWQNTAVGNAAAPNNLIAPMWDDLTPDGTSTISYATTGSAPNRVFIVNYDNIRHYTAGGTGVQNTFQVKLFESTGVIEMHGTNITSDGGTRTQGIENADATESYATTGRDNTTWSATNDFVAFVPNPGGLAENCGNSVTLSLSQTTFTCADIGDNIVTITADDGNGGVSTCDVTVTVSGTSSTFTISGGWDVTPNAGTAAVFSENFDTATFGDVTACSCDIPTGVTVEVNAGGTLDITGNINVDGILDIEHEGSVVQRNDDAAVNNGGTINVRKTTPTLNNRDFMVIGNPMTGTTRGNTFPGIITFRQHVTANFSPFTFSPSLPVGVENWADDNGDNWVNYSAGMNPGEGFLMRPQTAHTVPDGAVYNFLYDDGTLNNGVINFAVGYNGSQISSANVVGNPYASAIDADVFVADNSSMVGTIYFWEHITPPLTSYDGYNTRNYDMGDISMYLAGSGGTAAANGGTAPTQFIASGQGFGFKALAAGTLEFNNGQRVVGNNDQYKSTPVGKDQIWLNVFNETTRLGSQMLVAFVEGATQDFENYYDANRLATPVSLFSTLATGEQLTIQGREAFDIEDKITLGFASQIETNELFTISLDNVNRALMPVDVNIYLEDTVTGAIVNLSERDYSFSATASLQEDRFVMFFQEKVLGTDDNSLQALQLVPNPTSGVLNVMTPSNTTVDYVQVVDIRGRLVAQKRFNNTDSYVIDMSDLGSAVYFVKIFTTEGTITKRVIKQ